MLCRRGEYLLFSLRALERLAGLQQDFAAVRLARRLRACVFTRMVSVLVMHAAMNITRNVTEYRLTS